MTIEEANIKEQKEFLQMWKNELKAIENSLRFATGERSDELKKKAERLQQSIDSIEKTHKQRDKSQIQKKINNTFLRLNFSKNG